MPIMPTEYTPLITTVEVAPYRRRYPHNVFRRFCTIAISSVLIWSFLAFIFTLIFVPAHIPDHISLPGHHRRNVTYDQLRQILLDTPSREKAREWSKYYASGAHLAGKNFSQAAWTRDKWEEFGVKSDIVAYDVYINYPKDHRLALLKKKEQDDGASSWKVAFEASLVEDVLDNDPTSGLEERVPTFHGYSASGNVTGSLVYVNYGTFQDFEDLRKANVSLEGKVAIARYGGIFRGLKVKRAQELGIVGVIIYTDPGDDGENTVEKGVKPYPDGPARQPSSVQRGSVQFLSFAPGDPTTPGYPSKPGVPRLPVDHAIPSIPSIPISYLDALPILKALNGHGPNAKDFNQYWTRNTGLDYKGVEYNIGPTPDDVVVNLYNEQEYTTTPLWNVIGVINGTIPDEVIVVGNHRDAWIAGGAGDPNSGSAVLNEVIRSFGEAQKLGWKPLRTVVFASWDGEEYGLIGSTEWVEEYLPWLNKANVAYVNIDVGATGGHFSASAAPVLNDIIYAATAAVQSPNQTTPGQSVLDVWGGKISTMGSGSDFTAFQDFAGIPSLDIGFNPYPGDAVYHYHSNYDSFTWMEKYGDPGFVYHQTIAKILGLVTAHLVDVPVIPFSATGYADALDRYVKQVEDKLDSALSQQHQNGELDISSLTEEDIITLRASHLETSIQTTTTTTNNNHKDHNKNRHTSESFKRSLHALHKTITQFTKAAATLDSHSKSLSEKLKNLDKIPWWNFPKRIHLILAVRHINTKYKYLERNFLYDTGLDGRPWFKHVVFAPGLWTGYAGAVFPGLVESIDSRDWSNALRWVGIIDDCIKRAKDSI